MQSRPIAAAFFVVFCLLLCGLILHRQIAAHPLAAAMDRQDGGLFNGEDHPDRDRGMEDEGRFEDEKHLNAERKDFRRDMEDWHSAPLRITQEAQLTVSGQLTALHDGNPVQAFSYASQDLRRQIPTPAALEQEIRSQSPEFGKAMQVRYWQIWTDKPERRARAFVMVEGENGRHARGVFLLTLEDGQLKVSDLETQREQK